MKLGTAVFSLVLILALGVGATVAIGGGPGTPRLTGAKKKSGPYEKELRVKVRQQGRSVFVRVKSTHDARQKATIQEGLVGPGDPEADWQINWFRRDQDVSHDVQTSGYDFRLRPHKSKRFRVKLKPNVASPDPFCLYSNVQVDEPTTGRSGPFFAVNGPVDVLCAP
jgi:hypothetical protein